MTMKRNSVLLSLLILLFLTACGASGSASSEQTEGENTALQTIIIGGRTGGAWSVFTEGIAESIRREYDGSVITVEPGGIVENPPTVGMNKVPYGLSYTMTAYAAYKGEEPYDQPYEDIRAVSVVIPANYYQLVARADLGYDSLKEIIENKAPIHLAVDQKGSAGEIITRKMLGEYGVTYEDIISWGGSVDHLSGAKTFELMADKRVDVTGDAVSVPSSDILEASTTIDLKMLALEQQVNQSVADELGMLTGKIQAESYNFQKDDINTVNTPAILLVNQNVSEEEVYQVTKAIYENLDYLKTVHMEFENLSGENMMDVGDVPLHPGAVKFFKEKGWIDN
ncbi:TAXI family TRAP transporter solute-binding subunit [Virgibacillus halodenitrificans]|uniref:TAXI family TRAP transporter solute-binding subunit n=1 Tax=Virgibacillus halodenitrificans TaxID=1482 RepID=UPI0003028370|nr:TAXI family TRAP transporter solute-binding subunit [Virgibacillus halodenitrificans]